MAKEPRQSQINIRVSEDERKSFEIAADKAKVTVSEWVRTQARRAAGLDVA